MQKILILPHQSRYMQAPYLFPEIRYFMLVCGYGCVHADTEIETPHGDIKIKDFEGGAVYAYEEASRKRIITMASKPVAYKKVPMFEVTLSSGKKITVTAEHRFLTTSGYKPLSSFDCFHTTYVKGGSRDFLISSVLETLKIVDVRHIGKYLYYDMHVPVYHNYFACGAVHHNSGKTRANVFSLLYTVQALQGKKDKAGDYARLMVAGVTLSHLSKTFLTYLRQMLDQTKSRYTENKKDNYFVIGTVTVFIVPMENPGDIYGLDVHKIFVEEIDELTEDKAIEAIRSLSERCRQQIPGERPPAICLGSTAQGQKGLYRIYNHFKKNGVGFVLMRGRTQDNIYLPKELIQDMLKTYTPEEKRVFMDGEFLSIAKGRVFPDFNWERNYLDYDLDEELHPEETVYIGMDFNQSYNRASAYVVRDGVIYCVKDYDFPDAQDSPMVFRHDFPEQRILWIPDVTIKDSFPQYARELRRHGIQIIYRKKNPLVEDTAFLVNKLFYTGRLLVCRIAKNLAEACALFMRDKENKIPKGVGPSSPAHYCDGLRYVASFIAIRNSAFQDIRRLIVEKRASFRSDTEAPVKELGDGYTQIAPSAFLTRRRA
jgi:hypothetical protein